jgi:hypothetical protein
MAITHYEWLVREDRSAGVSALEKLQVLVVTLEVAAGHGALDQAPSSSRKRISTLAPRMQPSDGEDVPVKVIQIGVHVAQTTRIIGNLSDK